MSCVTIHLTTRTAALKKSLCANVNWVAVFDGSSTTCVAAKQKLHFKQTFGDV